MKYPTTWPEFQQLVKERFDLDYVVYKEKAGHLMVQERDSGYYGAVHSVVGPDAGYACPSSTWGFTYEGWGFYLTRDGEWKLAQDGGFGHRRGSNPFPELNEQIAYQG